MATEGKGRLAIEEERIQLLPALLREDSFLWRTLGSDSILLFWFGVYTIGYLWLLLTHLHPPPSPSSPHPRIVSHAILPSPSSSKSSTPSLAEATKSGAFLTYGPFEKTSPISLQGKGTNYVAQARVHFVHDMPVVSMVTLDRHVEVSHWGDNLATEDRIWLRNDGPKWVWGVGKF